MRGMEGNPAPEPTSATRACSGKRSARNRIHKVFVENFLVFGDGGEVELLVVEEKQLLKGIKLLPVGVHEALCEGNFDFHIPIIAHSSNFINHMREKFLTLWKEFVGTLKTLQLIRDSRGPPRSPPSLPHIRSPLPLFPPHRSQQPVHTKKRIFPQAIFMQVL